MTAARPLCKGLLRSLPKTSKGAALLVMLFLILATFSTIIVATVSRASMETQKRQKTIEAMARAKEALIAWSATRGSLAGSQRPGELPCPNVSDPVTDVVGYGNAPGSCTAGKIGRIPWKELGIAEPLDADGEPLWYAIDGAFRIRSGTAWTTNQPINSDTRASLKVYASDGSTLLTASGDEAAAVIFSAGPPLANQSRNTSPERISPANYLDSANGINNSTFGGPFIQGPVRDTNANVVLNDQLLVISGREIIAAAEKRVAGEAIKLLKNYKAANSAYPYPATYNATGCTDTGSVASISDCSSDANTCRGRFPDNAEEITTGLPNWGGSNPIPDWFSYNLWGQTLYYAVGSGSLKTPSPTLLSKCSSSLTIGAITGIKGVLITAGTPKGAIVRSKHTTPLISQSTSLADYLEDPANQDGWTGISPSADTYSNPGANSNDRIYRLP